MGTSLAINVDLEMHTVTCGGCGTVFAVTQDLYSRWNDDGVPIRCPRPACDWKSMVVKEAKVAKLQRELEEERKRAERATQGRRWAEEVWEVERRSHAATKGHLTRHRRRAAGGVCPCCHQTFKALAEHMKEKHPSYVKENSVERGGKAE